MNEIRPRNSSLKPEVKIYRVLFVLIICLVIGEGVFLYRTANRDSDSINWEENEVMFDETENYIES